MLLLGVSTVSASLDYNIKYGQSGSQVSELQDFLNDRGFLKVSPTGFFGLLTLRAVQDYQMSVNVPSTGYVGIMTRGEINKSLDTLVASSNQAEVAETGTTTVVVQTPQVVYVPQYVYVPQPVQQPKPVVVPVIKVPTCTMNLSIGTSTNGNWQESTVTWTSTDAAHLRLEGTDLQDAQTGEYNWHQLWKFDSTTFDTDLVAKGMHTFSPLLKARATFSGQMGTTTCEASDA